MPARLSSASNPVLSTDFEWASSGATSFFATRSIKASLSDTIPTDFPTCMMDGIWKVFASRIRLLTALVTIRTSIAAARPTPIFLAERLCDDALQRLGQHDADLRLTIRRELVDDAVDGRRRRGRVQRAEDEVAGLSGLDRDRHRLQSAHLAHQPNPNNPAGRSDRRRPIWAE